MDDYDIRLLIADAIGDLRNEIAQEIRLLRDEMNIIRQQLDRDLRGLERTLNSRTEHLA